MVGYSRLMAVDEPSTIAGLDKARAVFRREIEGSGGTVTDMAGDSVLAMFDTATGAVGAALAIQAELTRHAQQVPEAQRIMFRVGVHLGDILVKPDGSIYGDGVNVAARLQSIAPPGAVTVSFSVQVTVRGRDEMKFVDLGEHEVKNIPRPIRVFLVVDEHTAIEPGQPAATPVRVGNLPVPTNSLLGRAQALEAVVSRLDTTRLLTLLGMGGLGKTRLAIEAARKAAGRFPDGCWFVDLAAVTEPSAIGHAVAGVFGITQQSAKSLEQSVIESLATRRLLLVFDNCEHVVAAAGQLAHTILQSCPHARIIATSREALCISGEWVWHVPSLEVRGQDAPAVKLFIERARSVRADFEVGDEAETLQEICSELEGIPLAIELAAARIRSMSPAQISSRLGERFRLLTGGSRAVRERHQTLRQAVKWSFDLLTHEERAVLTRATVFAGGFGLEAAEKVCAGSDIDSFDVCDCLDSLARKSLVQVEPHANAVRYRMLETIRSFAAELLAQSNEGDATRRRHAEFYAAESDRNFEIWRSPRELEAYEWLDLEINNLRDAFRWALEQRDVDIAARIASDVGDTARFRLREEAANWAEDAVDLAREARHPRLSVLLTWCASSAWAFSRFDEAKKFGHEALELKDDPKFTPFIWAYGDLAFVALFSGQVDEAIELLRQGSQHPADRVDRFMLAFLLFVSATAGHREQAREMADEVVRKVDATGVPMSIAVAYGGKGAALEHTDPEASLAAYEHSVQTARNAGCRFMETLVAPRLAALHARSGEPVVALEGFERMLESFGEATDIASVSAWRASLIVLLTKLGQLEASATLHGTLGPDIDTRSVVPEHPDAIAKVRETLGAEKFVAAAGRGAEMSLRQASNYAIEQVRVALQSLAANPG